MEPSCSQLRIDNVKLKDQKMSLRQNVFWVCHKCKTVGLVIWNWFGNSSCAVNGSDLGRHPNKELLIYLCCYHKHEVMYFTVLYFT